MYGSMWPFYSCMGLMTRDTGIPQVNGLSTDPQDLGCHSLVSELR